jgi:exopolysaccharide biosynthesis predicted pyruvyltransferase EpsI
VKRSMNCEKTLVGYSTKKKKYIYGDWLHSCVLKCFINTFAEVGHLGMTYNGIT